MSVKTGRPAGLEIMEGKLGCGLSLKGVDEADPEDVFLPWVTRGLVAVGETMGILAFSAIGPPGQGIAADGLTNDGPDLVLFNQSADGIGGLDLSLLVSTKNSSTFLPIRTFGFREWAV